MLELIVFNNSLLVLMTPATEYTLVLTISVPSHHTVLLFQEGANRVFFAFLHMLGEVDIVVVVPLITIATLDL